MIMTPRANRLANAFFARAQQFLAVLMAVCALLTTVVNGPKLVERIAKADAHQETTTKSGDLKWL